MQHSKKRDPGQRNWEDNRIILFLSLVVVILIIFLIVDFSNAEHKNKKDITTPSLAIVLPLKEAIPMECIPQEFQIAYEAVIIAENAYEKAVEWCEAAKTENEKISEISDSVKNATTLAEYTEITRYVLSVSSAAEESAFNAVKEAEKAIIAMLDSAEAVTIIPEVQSKHESTELWTGKAVTEANSAIDYANQAKEKASKVIDDLEQKCNLICTMARVIYAEAHGEPLLGKIAVGATIVNRLSLEYFPDTIEEVLEGQYATYEWVTDEHLATYPECIEAAERAIMGEDPLAEKFGEPTVYFLNPETSVQKEVEYRKTKKNLTIGHHMFSGLSLYW